MKKKIDLIFILILGGILLTIFIFRPKTHALKETVGVFIVPTLDDTIGPDSSWCATFQLIWNDLKNEVAKQDIVFNNQEKFAENLNKEGFTEEMISNDYYYKIYGPPTFSLKKQIEKAIKEKFNQTSDILEQFAWQEEASADYYFFYTMLYREFEFLQKFEPLNKGNFGKYQNIRYFGIDQDTNQEVKNQIEVLYYNSVNDFAFLINTKSDDEVIFYKNPKGDTFQNIYDTMMQKTNQYTGSKFLNSSDELKVPYLDFNILRDYTELENKEFPLFDGKTGSILKAIQTIQFSLDEKGGKIKSEAAMMAYSSKLTSEEARLFYLDDTFALFLREKGKSIPYFAGRIEDITKFQQ